MIENFRFKKQFGQNFISDTNLLKSIVADSKIDENTAVLEVGAGAGALTFILAEKAKKVVAFEIDNDLKGHLLNKFENTKNVRLIFADALKTSTEEINEIIGEDFALVANLPYYITTPLIFKFLDNAKCKSLTIMVQKEVAERIVSRPNHKSFGILSVKIGAQANAKITRIVSRKLFHPMPNVDSAIVRIEKKETNFNLAMFNTLVNSAFAMRRKTLQNNLTASLLTKQEFAVMCEDLGLSPLSRAENIEIDDFIKISKYIEKLKK